MSRASAGREAASGGEGIVRKALLALALLGAAAFLPRLVRRLRAQPRRLSAAELRQRLARSEDIVVLDVRPAKDYSGELGHVEGALNIPLEELPSRLAELEPRRDRTLAVMCRANRMSGRAVELLRNAGFKQALLVEDGSAGARRTMIPYRRSLRPERARGSASTAAPARSSRRGAAGRP